MFHYVLVYLLAVLTPFVLQQAKLLASCLPFLPLSCLSKAPKGLRSSLACFAYFLRSSPKGEVALPLKIEGKGQKRSSCFAKRLPKVSTKKRRAKFALLTLIKQAKGKK